ncbi:MULTISPECIES: HpcH/HpaI aldolase family protein [unclassified Sporosarcina]|uniref:HpcH/HpaI aldolase family protein n=1 Tax=unclassified Sporosarcina TaxID=2647733 RepID=UPI0030FA2088
MGMSLKEKISSGENTIGIFVGIYSPAIVEMCGHANFDFIVIDDEHGAFSYSELENMIRTAELVNLVPIVRVSYDDSSIQKALDRGAKGLHIPMVNTKEDALQVIQRAKYPPIGNRGAAYSHRAARYGKDVGENFLDSSNEQLLISVHIETPEAVRNFEEIMSVEGIDLAFLGTTDLSVSMGYRDGIHHKEVKDAISQVYEKAKKINVPIGTVANSVDAANQAFEDGAVYVVSVGTTLISNTLLNFVHSTINSEI